MAASNSASLPSSAANAVPMAQSSESDDCFLDQVSFLKEVFKKSHNRFGSENSIGIACRLGLIDIERMYIRYSSFSSWASSSLEGGGGGNNFGTRNS